MLMLGDPYAEMLALIYAEFQRWKEILNPEFQAYSLKGTG